MARWEVVNSYKEIDGLDDEEANERALNEGFINVYIAGNNQQTIKVN